MVLAVRAKSAGSPTASAAKTDNGLPEEPGRRHREEVGLARAREVDRAGRPRYSLEQDAGVLERAARLALAQEGAIQVALVRFLDLRMRDQFVKDVRTTDHINMVAGRRPGFSSSLPRQSEARVMVEGGGFGICGRS